MLGTLPTGVSQVYFTDRPAVGEPFRTPMLMAGAPRTSVLMTADCSRIYFIDLSTVFFAERR